MPEMSSAEALNLSSVRRVLSQKTQRVPGTWGSPFDVADEAPDLSARTSGTNYN